MSGGAGFGQEHGQFDFNNRRSKGLDLGLGVWCHLVGNSLLML